uniref:Uncharacterized protein n=1 Tax=Anguilla anguilla TaxID=7936 RepID=A0A0E9SML9_ANGAN
MKLAFSYKFIEWISLTERNRHAHLRKKTLQKITSITFWWELRCCARCAC